MNNFNASRNFTGFRHASAIRLAIIALLVGAILNGCTPYIIAGAAVGAGAIVVSDRRNIENMFEDQAIEMRATDALYKDAILAKKIKVDIISYNGIVLITGHTPTDDMRTHAGNIVYAIRNVKEVYNEIRIGDRPNGEQSASDTWITTKAKTLLIGKRGFPTHTKVVTVNGNVYLMGLATGEEARRAQDALVGVSGVKEVIALFEPVDEEMRSLLKASSERLQKAPMNSTPKNTTNAKPKTSEEDDFAVMPYKIEKPGERPAGVPTEHD